MATETPTPPSFSSRQKWSIGFNVFIKTLAVFAVVAGLVYISAGFFSKRFYLSSQTHFELSPRSRALLDSLTNRIRITLYFDREDSLYDSVSALADEYRLANRSRISVDTIDYLHDAGNARSIKARYNLFSPTDKNLVIIENLDYTNRFKIIHGDLLGKSTLEPIPSEDPMRPEFRRKLLEFHGELRFTSALLEVISPKPLKACVLQGHGLPALDDAREVSGLARFAETLRHHYIQVEPLASGSNAIPLDCNLLVIVGPRKALPAAELERIDQYLEQGGRLFIAFDFYSVNERTGLETVLAKWGVNVSHAVVRDLAKTYSGPDIGVTNFSRQHPVAEPLVGGELYLYQPRMVSAIPTPANAVDAPKVQELAFSSPQSLLTDNSLKEPRSLPLIVASEKGAPKGATTERGSTRILVVGDSLFLGNTGITSLGNSDFVSFAANWLLDRGFLVQGVGRKPMNEFRILMTPHQRRTATWILLGAIPGAILVFGGLVWLRRRQ